MMIIHHGEGSPDIDNKTCVDVTFRDGRVDKGFSVSWYQPWAGTHDHWTHDGSIKDIVSYVIRDQKQE